MLNATLTNINVWIINVGIAIIIVGVRFNFMNGWTVRWLDCLEERATHWYVQYQVT